MEPTTLSGNAKANCVIRTPGSPKAPFPSASSVPHDRATLGQVAPPDAAEASPLDCVG